jgi:hypothetical protein
MAPAGWCGSADYAGDGGFIDATRRCRRIRPMTQEEKVGCVNGPTFQPR